ncbi:hypothetical protein CR513_02168, partial [Mucuna pruriens]
MGQLLNLHNVHRISETMMIISSSIHHSGDKEDPITEYFALRGCLFRFVTALIIMHQPGIEPGSVPWQGTILPLDHWCFVA